MTRKYRLKAIQGSNPIQFTITPIPDEFRVIMSEDEFKEIINTINNACIKSTEIYFIFKTVMFLLLLFFGFIMICWVNNNIIGIFIMTPITSITFFFTIYYFVCICKDIRKRKRLFHSLNGIIDVKDISLMFLYDNTLKIYFDNLVIEPFHEQV